MAFQPKLAAVLHNLALRYLEIGEVRGAFAENQEAVRLLDNLAKSHAAAYGDPPAQALQSAQTWLRTLPKQDVPAELERLQSHLGAAEEPVLRSIDALRNGGDHAPISSWRGRQPAFRLPYFWAPFILVGGG